ncbi:MAG: T9SS C-terminal target domain-containing protein [Saprospirales bacterium]|nr:MAG: T9SS C-terminal target domain-containing protein [Saprospirales bacterium]
MIKICQYALLTLSAFFFLHALYGQAAMNIGAKKFLAEYDEIVRSDETIDAEFREQYDLMRKNEELYIGVTGLVNTQEFNVDALDRLNIENDTRINDLWTFRVPVSNLQDFLEIRGLKYIEIAEPVDPYLIHSTVDSRTDSVNRGLGLPESLRGEGVIIAIIDWGFDYTHPNFFDSTLTNLRISRAWDQNKLSGPAPEGYSFGTEYVGQDALLQAQSDTLYVFGPSSHGTHVAGIAGGSGGGTAYSGAAPESELIFISLRRDGPSLVDAFQYITDYAASEDKPYVVNMSFGSHLGPHDGTSLKNYGIDMLHGPGRVFVGSAGNNGNAPFHLDMNFTDAPGDTMRTVVGFGSGPEIFGQTISMWGSEASSFSASVKLVNSSDETIHQTPFYHTQDEPSVNERMEFDDQEFHIILEGVYGHFLNDKPSLRWEIRNTTPYRVVLEVTSQNSHVHMWNCMRHERRFTNWGQPFSSDYPGALDGDILYGVGEPGGVGINVITVGAYLRSIFNVFGTEIGGNLSNFTSSGPTVDGRNKPDITSTGQGVVSSVNSFDPSQTAFAATTEFNGRTYGFTGFSGTSMSGPMVAGIVALMLEANPELSAQEIRSILIETARIDHHVGDIPEQGHLRWGFGKANALAAVRAAMETTHTNELNFTPDFLTIYPNPAANHITLTSKDGQNTISEILLIDMNGRVVNTFNPGFQASEYQIDVSGFSTGNYLLQYRTEQGIGFSRILIAR